MKLETNPDRSPEEPTMSDKRRQDAQRPHSSADEAQAESDRRRAAVAELDRQFFAGLREAGSRWVPPTRISDMQASSMTGTSGSIKV